MLLLGPNCQMIATVLFLAQVLQATAYVFCADLQSVPQGGTHSVAFINFALVQDTRPTTSDWPSISPEGPHVYARIAIRSAAVLPAAAACAHTKRTTLL